MSTHLKYQAQHAAHQARKVTPALAVTSLALGGIAAGGSIATATPANAMTAHQAHLEHCRIHPGACRTGARTVAQTATHLATSAALAAYARSFAGWAYYVYGGTGPRGFDCSGLAQYVYRHLGYSIPRIANDQARHFRATSSPRPGDLVFSWSGGYAYHTGVYLGGGLMVSALNSYYGVRVTPLSWAGSHSFGTILH